MKWGLAICRRQSKQSKVYPFLTQYKTFDSQWLSHRAYTWVLLQCYSTFGQYIQLSHMRSKELVENKKGSWLHRQIPCKCRVGFVRDYFELLVCIQLTKYAKYVLLSLGVFSILKRAIIDITTARIVVYDILKRLIGKNASFRMLYNGYSCTKMPFILFILIVVQIQQYKIESVFIKLTNAFNINYERLISLKMLRNIFSLGLSLSIFGGASYGYIFYKTKKNKAQYQLTLQSDTLKDASRLTNDSFGISWGFQADDTIMKRIDSGDLFFVKFDCQECLSVEQFVNCHFYTMFLLDQQFHTVGMGYRTQAGLQIIYNEFGTTLKRSYTDFVGLPYLKQLSIQRTDHQQYPTIHQQLSDLVLKEPQSIFKKQSPINFINNLSNKLKMEYTKYGNRIRNLRQLIITQEMINVRTQTNRALRSL